MSQRFRHNEKATASLALGVGSLFIVAFFLIVFALPKSANAQAYTLTPLPDLVNYHDFVVGPGKIELTLSPGQSATVNVTVANRLGSDKTFSVTEEDFTGSQDPKQTVVLLGSDRGPYSLKDDLRIPASTILIPFGKKAIIPVTISIPADAEPGGLYGSVVVSVLSTPGVTPAAGVVGANPIITRVATLFFVRIPGPVTVSGHLTQFSLPVGNIIWSSSLSKTNPILFDLLFRNDSNVYVDPSGTISITNIFGSPVGNIDVEPWFAMPNSLRFRQVEWDPFFLFGRYVAQASINPGFGSTTDTAEVVFWVIPWTLLLLIFAALVIAIGGVRWIFSRFSIVSKK